MTQENKNSQNPENDEKNHVTGQRLIVNGREKEWEENIITFQQVVILAFGNYDPNPNKVYTVTYDRGPHKNPEGSMVNVNTVFLKNKMIFNVTATDKS